MEEFCLCSKCMFSKKSKSQDRNEEVEQWEASPEMTKIDKNDIYLEKQKYWV